jgi:hypothetical protein
MNRYAQVLINKGCIVRELNDGIVEILAFDSIRCWDEESTPPCFDPEVYGDAVPVSAIVFPSGELHLIDSSHEEYALILPAIKISNPDELPDVLQQLGRAFEDEKISVEEATEIAAILILAISVVC